jgi:hypothetical protein
MRFVPFCAAVFILTHQPALASDLMSRPALPDGPPKISPARLAQEPTAGMTSAFAYDEPIRASGQEVPRTAEYSRQELCDVVILAAQAYNLPVAFFMRLIWQESGFKPQTVSRAGAQGIAQFMPETAAEMGLEDPFDPMQALPVSARFLHDLHQQFGNHGLAAAAYNAGPRRVTAWLARRASLPSETRAYVLSVTGRSAEQWVGPKKTVASLTIPADMRCQQMAAPIVAAQKARWSRQALRPRVMRAKFERPAGPMQSAAPAPQEITLVVRPDVY